MPRQSLIIVKYGLNVLVGFGQLVLACLYEALRSLELLAQAVNVQFIVFHLGNDVLQLSYRFFVFHCCLRLWVVGFYGCGNLFISAKHTLDKLKGTQLQYAFTIPLQT